MFIICQASVSYFALLHPSFHFGLNNLGNAVMNIILGYLSVSFINKMTMKQSLESIYIMWQSNPAVLLPPLLWFGLLSYLCFSAPSASSVSPALQPYKRVHCQQCRYLARIWRKAKVKLHRHLTRWLLGGVGPCEKVCANPTQRFQGRCHVKGCMRFNKQSSSRSRCVP
jgi:hypothetical protein